MESINFATSAGKPLPFGATAQGDGINFSIYSPSSQALTLCLFHCDIQTLVQEILLDPKQNRTGDVWHIHVHHLPTGLLYAFRSSHLPGLLMTDPYAKAIQTSNTWGITQNYRPLGVITDEETFDWENVQPPAIPPQDLIIYEMHVRAFTQHPSSGVAFPGTFLGIIEKIPYLKSLGINAIELLPIHEFNENENKRTNPMTQEKLYNFWGYSPVNFFSAMNRYAGGVSPGASCQEFKILVKELHRAGIEVILDVVFNHTAEGELRGPIYSFRGLDDASYYIHNNGTYLDFTGCGNTFNGNHPIGRELIIHCLRYWAVEMHVDGFRFDLASVLTRDRKGIPRENAPVIEAITLDPILKDKKLIAECWDASGLYQVGNFYPQIGRWIEWNGKYRDCIRRFINGDRHFLSKFATRLCGSQDLYGKTRRPYHSLNFVVAHDGFTLADLVTYNHKHNKDNGENNHDGINHNDSWNCGVEGDTSNPEILALRRRQMRNYFLAHMVSQGIPMILMGDEYTHTKQGNNNSWCQDNAINWFLWDQLEAKDKDFTRFYRLMIQFRKKHSILRHTNFLTDAEVVWHSTIPNQQPWSGESNLIAMTLVNPQGEDLYIAFNAQNKEETIHLPDPKEGMQWTWAVNTAAEAPHDIVDEGKIEPLKEAQYTMKPFSAILLEEGRKSS